MQNKNIEIIVIEDEEDILELIEYHLEKEGYSATGFLTAENVEQFLEEENPSLIQSNRKIIFINLLITNRIFRNKVCSAYPPSLYETLC